MYDMYIFKGIKNGRINETKIRHWLTNFEGEIIKTKFMGGGRIVIIYKKAESCKEEKLGIGRVCHTIEELKRE